MYDSSSYLGPFQATLLGMTHPIVIWSFRATLLGMTHPVVMWSFGATLLGNRYMTHPVVLDHFGQPYYCRYDKYFRTALLGVWVFCDHFGQPYKVWLIQLSWTISGNPTRYDSSSAFLGTALFRATLLGTSKTSTVSWNLSGNPTSYDLSDQYLVFLFRCEI